MALPLISLTWLKGNWKMLAIVGGLVFLVIAGWVILGWRADAERLKKVREEAEQVEKQRKADEALLRQQLEAEQGIRLEAERRENEARAQAQQMAALAQQLGAQVGALGARQTAVRREVEGLPAAELERRIQTDLGLRRVDDARPGFYPEELRGLAHCTSEYPLCQQKTGLLEQRLTALEGQLQAQGAQIAALGDQVASEKRSRVAWEQGYTNLKGHYVTLYNSIGVKKRSLKCLGLWKCGTRTLPTPNPAELAIQP